MESLNDTLRKTYKLAGLPVYQNKYCISASSFGCDCDKCVSLCPENLFTGGRKSKKPDFTKCTKCGICAAVCPNRGISPIDTQVRSFLMALARNDELSAGCGRNEQGWTVSYECLAALSWEQIACAALKNGIAVSIGACSGCEKQACAAEVMETLRKTKEFLGDDLFFDKVRLLEDQDACEVRGNAISRRELFTFFKRMPLDTAVNMLPELKPTERNALFYRALLRDIVQERYKETPKQERTRYTVTLPLIAEGCTGCGMCARMCPEKALAVQTGAEGSMLVTAEAWKCLACGKCEKACSKKAIGGMAKMSVPHLGTVLIKRLKKETTV